MDGFQFTADVFKSLVSLAWPAAFVGAVYMFREKLTALLPLLRLKYKDLDISFRLDQAEKEANALPAPAQTTDPTPEETDNFLRLAKVSPRAAIMERRLGLEDALQTFARSVGMSASQPTSMLRLTRELRKNGLIDQATSALLDDLRAIGNTAAHNADTSISEDDAIRFGKYAERLIQQLQISTAAAQMPPPAPLNPH
jgi:hypothetical protein